MTVAMFDTEAVTGVAGSVEVEGDRGNRQYQMKMKIIPILPRMICEMNWEREALKRLGGSRN